jgi:chromosome segregation ATPase
MSEVLDARLTELEQLVYDIAPMLNLRFDHLRAALAENAAFFAATEARLGTIDTQIGILLRDIRDMRGGVTRQLIGQDDLLREIDKRLTAVEQRLASLEANDQALSNRMTSMEGHMTSMEGRMTSMEGHMTSVEGHMTSMEGRMTSMEGRMTSMEERVTSIEGHVTRIELEHGQSLARIEAVLGQVLQRLPAKA